MNRSTDLEEKDELSIQKRIEFLIEEWNNLEASIKWNFEIYERHRYYLFLGVTAIFGLEKSTEVISSVVWIPVPFIAILLLFRMISQQWFVAVKGYRNWQIEEEIESLTKNTSHYRYQHLQRQVERDNPGPYLATQVAVYFCAFVFVFYSGAVGSLAIAEIYKPSMGVVYALVVMCLVASWTKKTIDLAKTANSLLSG